MRYAYTYANHYADANTSTITDWFYPGHSPKAVLRHQALHHHRITA
jgi:hypothetical protein